MYFTVCPAILPSGELLINICKAFKLKDCSLRFVPLFLFLPLQVYPSSPPFQGVVDQKHVRTLLISLVILRRFCGHEYSMHVRETDLCPVMPVRILTLATVHVWCH